MVLFVQDDAPQQGLDVWIGDHLLMRAVIWIAAISAPISAARRSQTPVP